MRPYVVSLSCLLALPALSVAVAAPPASPRYLQLVNDAHASVVELRAAAHATGTFQTVALDGALRGGGEGQTVALSGGTCRYDLRFGFADGRSLRYQDVDLCRYGQVRIRALPREATAGRDYVVSWRPAADDAGRLAGQEAAPPSH